MPGPGNVGERVRNLRLTRRLSQAQLAGRDLSDSYISLIESGKRTPTPTVIRLLAERLGCTPEYLAEGIEPEERLHLEVRERLAELILLGGRHASALESFEEILARSDHSDLIARAEWGRARALEGLGQVGDAISVYEALRERSERDPGSASWLPAVIALARCYHAVGDLGQAIALGERALARLRELELTIGEEHAEVGRVLLTAYADRSDHERARQLRRDILPGDDLAIGSAADIYGRAGERALQQGAVGDALYLANRALAVHEEDSRERSHARLRMSGARSLLRGLVPGDRTVPAATGAATGATTEAAAEALDLLQRAAAHLSGTEAHECTIETARALVILDRTPEAVAAVEDLLSALTGRDGEDAFSAMRARLVLAQAHIRQGDTAKALIVLRDTATGLQKLPPCRLTAKISRELGDLFHEVGYDAGAREAYRWALEAAGLKPAGFPQPTPDTIRAESLLTRESSREPGRPGTTVVI